MRERRFRPGDLIGMERRLLLSGDVATLTRASKLIGGAVAGQPTSLGRNRRIGDMINQSFDNFTNDYLQAQSAYLSPLSSTNGAGAAPSSSSSVLFTSFIRQRINLLSQELVQELGRVSGTLRRLPASKRGQYGNSDTYLQAFLHNRINGAPAISLRSNLLKLTASVPTDQSAATLFTLNATNAIETARAATLNAAGFVANGNFGVKNG